MNGKADPWAGNDLFDWQDGSFLIDMARSLERAGFDYIMLEDHVAFDAMAGHTARLDPVALMPAMAAATERLGIIGTLSTGFYHPFALARLMQSMDHVSHGRIGWNIVTTSEQAAAEAFGLTEQPKHDERYDRADEFVDLATQLWATWDEGAVVADPTTGAYVDRDKVHPIDFDGRWFKSKGALNVPPGPQGRPIVCQAGSSPRGREFGARWADTLLYSTGGQNDAKVMRDIRNDMTERLIAAGRDPKSVKCMFMVTPIIADSEDEAWAKHHARYDLTDDQVIARLKGMGENLGGFDFLRFDIDAPFEPVTIHHEGHQGTFGNFLALADGKRSLREMVLMSRVTSLDLVGTPQSVADQMEAAMETAGGDGFLIQSRPLTRRYISEIVDGLVPELQRRGLVRKTYEHATLRENLMAF
jgi:FMN-dependent oxidoreductase (nitrilotriacetate monooxygenase family)